MIYVDSLYKSEGFRVDSSDCETRKSVPKISCAWFPNNRHPALSDKTCAALYLDETLADVTGAQGFVAARGQRQPR